jgi:hypothetical protein
MTRSGLLPVRGLLQSRVAQRTFRRDLKWIMVAVEVDSILRHDIAQRDAHRARELDCVAPKAPPHPIRTHMANIIR